ncbi:hypothetical protein D3C72_2505040 [compost metagenome]
MKAVKRPFCCSRPAAVCWLLTTESTSLRVSQSLADDEPLPEPSSSSSGGSCLMASGTCLRSASGTCSMALLLRRTA